MTDKQYAEHLAETMKPLDYGDPEISKALKHLHHLYISKGLPCRELMLDSISNRVRYIVMQDGPIVSITDLETDDTIIL